MARRADLADFELVTLGLCRVGSDEWGLTALGAEHESACKAWR